MTRIEDKSIIQENNPYFVNDNHIGRNTGLAYSVILFPKCT